MEKHTVIVSYIYNEKYKCCSCGERSCSKFCVDGYFYSNMKKIAMLCNLHAFKVLSYSVRSFQHQRSKEINTRNIGIKHSKCIHYKMIITRITFLSATNGTEAQKKSSAL